jgi:hypothetical protein
MQTDTINKRIEKDGSYSNSIEPIAFSVFKINDTTFDINQTKSKYKDSELKEIFTAGNYLVFREVSKKLNLQEGNYIIIPSMFDKDVGNKFILRIFTEGEASTEFSNANSDFQSTKQVQSIESNEQIQPNQLPFQDAKSYQNRLPTLPNHVDYGNWYDENSYNYSNSQVINYNGMLSMKENYNNNDQNNGYMSSNQLNRNYLHGQNNFHNLMSKSRVLIRQLYDNQHINYNENYQPKNLRQHFDRPNHTRLFEEGNMFESFLNGAGTLLRGVEALKNSPNNLAILKQTKNASKTCILL